MRFPVREVNWKLPLRRPPPPPVKSTAWVGADASRLSGMAACCVHLGRYRQVPVSQADGAFGPRRGLLSSGRSAPKSLSRLQLSPMFHNNEALFQVEGI